MQHELHLDGPVVRLEPLDVAHAADLAALGDADAYSWHTSRLPLSTQAAAESIWSFLESPEILPLAVVDTATHELRGMTSFYDHVPAVPRVEIGHTFYGRRFWGGDTNPHVKLLMLAHAFGEWSCERVALRCDADNVRSAGAIRRLGATPEGVLRAHRRRHDGTVADTAYFSIVRAEWPAVRHGLAERVLLAE